jgi:hypothetical protein
MLLKVEGVASISHQECWTHPAPAFLYVSLSIFSQFPVTPSQVKGPAHDSRETDNLLIKNRSRQPVNSIVLI